MRKLILGCAAGVLTLSAVTASVAQDKRRPNASVELTVTDAAGKRIELGSLPQADRQRVISLRNNIQQWGNQQSRPIRVTLSCKYPPLSCTLTVNF
ncbi:MAG TPA: hypothetical protein VGC35_00515 [Allosphingosinicella sp.]|jgi:hypothetical protein